MNSMKAHPFVREDRSVGVGGAFGDGRDDSSRTVGVSPTCTLGVR